MKSYTIKQLSELSGLNRKEIRKIRHKGNDIRRNN